MHHLQTIWCAWWNRHKPATFVWLYALPSQQFGWLKMTRLQFGASQWTVLFHVPFMHCDTDHLWPKGPGVLWVCCLDCIAELCFKKRWTLLILVLRPDDGRSSTGRNVGVILFCFVWERCRLSLFKYRQIVFFSKIHWLTFTSSNLKFPPKLASNLNLHLLLPLDSSDD